MKKLSCLLLLIVSFFYTGCQDSTDAYKVTKHLIGRQLDMSWEKEIFPGNNGDLSNDSIKYKVVMCVSHELCMDCLINYIEACNRYAKRYGNDKLAICIILDNEYDEVKEAISRQETNPNFFLIRDKNQSFLRNNSIEKYTEHFHSFLLDNNNRILLIGDPIRNKKVFDLYDKEIRS